MSIHNKEIADKLNEVAGLLDIKGENPFRIRSYREAAKAISGMSEDLAARMSGDGKLEDIPGVGESIAEKIKEMIDSGELKQLKELKREMPASLLELLKLEQLGPRRIGMLHQKLGIESVDDLKKAIEKGEIENLSGFGKKMSRAIAREVDDYYENDEPGRYKLDEVEEQAETIRKYLDKELDNVIIAGSYRRKKETVGDIDIVATAGNPGRAMDYFTSFDEASKVLSKGKTRSSLVLRSGIHVDLRIVEKKSYGAALLYFTGSRAHTIALRKTGRDKNMKVNEYGIYKGRKVLASETEEDMYRQLGLEYIEPELREDRGELDASRSNSLPGLVRLEDVKGDLHTHTRATDGLYSVKEMAEAAGEEGYQYYAVSDHSKRVSMAAGLDEKRLAEQIREIESENRKSDKLRILKSVEVDILEDGTLDLPDDILKKLDLVICAIHYHQKLSRKKQTKRVLKAMENPYFNILAHPTGRIIGKRRGYDIDMRQVMREAKNNGCFLEINAAPDRLDLDDDHIRMAKNMDLKLSVATDAHSTGQLKNMRYGVYQARRGWLEKDDLINTLSWEELKKILKRN